MGDRSFGQRKPRVLPPVGSVRSHRVERIPQLGESRSGQPRNPLQVKNMQPIHAKVLIESSPQKQELEKFHFNQSFSASVNGVSDPQKASKPSTKASKNLSKLT